MPDEPVITPEETSQGLTEAEMESLVGRVVDARLEPLTAQLKTISAPDMDAFRTSLLDDVRGIFAENKTEGGAGLDKDDLLKSVGEMLDGKLRDFSKGRIQRRPGPLSRMLGAN